MRFLHFIISLTGAFAFCIVAIIVLSMVFGENINVTLGLFSIVTFVFVLVGSLFGELLFQLLRVNTWRVGAMIYFLSGVKYMEELSSLLHP